MKSCAYNCTVTLYNLVNAESNGRGHVNSPPRAFNKRERHDKAKQLEQEERSDADPENTRQPTPADAEAACDSANEAHTDVNTVWINLHVCEFAPPNGGTQPRRADDGGQPATSRQTRGAPRRWLQ